MKRSVSSEQPKPRLIYLHLHLHLIPLALLCDQHGRELDSLQDEDFSVCLCVQVEP